MKQTLLILENDGRIEANYVVKRFLREWKGETIPHRSLRLMDREELLKKLNKATHILSSTSLAAGSESQFEDMFPTMAAIREPKEIYISLHKGAEGYIRTNFSDEKIHGIAHHNIYDWTASDESFEKEWQKIDFTDIYTRHQTRLDQHIAYMEASITRTTGRKIKVLACTAFGKAFENLPIGQVVDELNMSKVDAQKGRGVWIMGNGEPIKLVNDNGNPVQEFAIECVSVEDLAYEIGQTGGTNLKKNEDIDYIQLLKALRSKEVEPTSIANEMCEVMGIEKRHNRGVIVRMINEFRQNNSPKIIKYQV